MVPQIISGGQTGADRAALDWAIENGVPHGGWCPRDRLAEDGPIAAHYSLTETPSKGYLERNECNVRDAGATAIFTITAKLGGGSLRTSGFARKLRKPWIHLSLEGDGVKSGAARLSAFLEGSTVRILNVAGSRASKEPDVAAFVRAVLTRVFT